MRTKISFNEINKGKITIIPFSDIAESKQRIRSEMKPVVREYIKKSVQSSIQPGNLIINI